MAVLFSNSVILLVSLEKATVLGNGLAVQSAQLLPFLHYIKESWH